VSAPTKPPAEPPVERWSEAEADYLLSAGGLGGEQRDRIFAAVVASGRVRDDRRRVRASWTWRRWSIATGAAGFATVALLLVGGQLSRRHDPFQSRGGQAAAPVSVDVECLRAALGACPRKSIVAFSVRGASTGAFVSAYLDPGSATSAAPTWLLSNEPVTAQAPGDAVLLARGAEIPEGQASGAYRLEVLVTNRPISREETARPRSKTDLLALARFPLTVVP
jgi:hypothetical protein